MEKSISYSVYIDNKNKIISTDNNNNINNINNETEPLHRILPIRTYSWVDDNTVTKCYNCSKQFTLLFRRHHCRFCGKIFCSPCVNHFADIPNDLLSDYSKESWSDYISSYVYTKTSTTKYKVCKNCLDSIEKIDSVRRIIDLLILLNCDIEQLKIMAILCKLWNYAINYILTIFRNTQYKLPLDNYNEIEKKLLTNNYKYFSGHNKYTIQLIKIANCDDDYIKINELLKMKKDIMLVNYVYQKL